MFHSSGTVQSNARVPLGTSCSTSDGNSALRYASVVRTPSPVRLRQIGKSSVAHLCRSAPVSIRGLLASCDGLAAMVNAVQQTLRFSIVDDAFHRKKERLRADDSESGALSRAIAAVERLLPEQFAHRVDVGLDTLVQISHEKTILPPRRDARRVGVVPRKALVKTVWDVLHLFDVMVEGHAVLVGKIKDRD